MRLYDIDKALEEAIERAFDPETGELISEDALAEVDPEYADLYFENAAVYVEQIEALDEEYHETAEHAEQKVLLFGDRYPFSYLLDKRKSVWLFRIPPFPPLRKMPCNLIPGLLAAYYVLQQPRCIFS